LAVRQGPAAAGEEVEHSEGRGGVTAGEVVGQVLREEALDDRQFEDAVLRGRSSARVRPSADQAVQ
jgi:hypothetical protein